MIENVYYILIMSYIFVIFNKQVDRRIVGTNVYLFNIKELSIESLMITSLMWVCLISVLERITVELFDMLVIITWCMMHSMNKIIFYITIEMVSILTTVLVCT